jgi:hypothetical protein
LLTAYQYWYFHISKSTMCECSVAFGIACPIFPADPTKQQSTINHSIHNMRRQHQRSIFQPKGCSKGHNLPLKSPDCCPSSVLCRPRTAATVPNVFYHSSDRSNVPSA